MYCVSLDFLFCFGVLNVFYFLHFRQIERDCEFLEAERIMDYSLLVGLHFRDDNRYDKIGLSPFVLRTGKYSMNKLFQHVQLLNELEY